MQAVLAGNTKGYTQHPQLDRFKATSEPLCAIGCYLTEVACEADARAYNFDKRKILSPVVESKLPLTTGQLAYEWQHLKRKLEIRDPDRYSQLKPLHTPDPHPLFTLCNGDIEAWEVVA